MEPDKHYSIRLTGDDWWRLHEFARTQLAERASLGGQYDREYYEHMSFLSRLFMACADAKRIGE